jgi:hypothetical protein
MKLFSTTMFLILIAASPAFSLWEQNGKTAADEANYKRVNGFSGYLTLDDEPLERVRRWLDPARVVTISAVSTMKRGKTMGAFVELQGCEQNARGVCNARVDFTIYKPDGGIFVTRAVRQRGILWTKQATSAPRRSSPKTTGDLHKRGRKMGEEIASNQSWGLARMHFKLGKDDPVGDYKVKAKVTDLNTNISLELELDFYLK